MGKESSLATSVVPSTLLRACLNDLRTVENDPRYVIDMSVWHEPRFDGCHVCLYGAMLAQEIQPYVKWQDARHPVALAVDRFRRGWINMALEYLEIEHPVGLPMEVPVHPYVEDKNLFYKDMESLITLLKEHGL